MTEQNQNDSFDRELAELLPENPPEDLCEAVNPWHKPVMQIVFGLGLVSLVIHFFNLNFILPAIGWLLLLLGFRTLRRENIWFRLGWISSVIGSSAVFFQLILNSTIWGGEVFSSSVYLFAVRILMFLQPAQDLFLWLGFRSVRRNTGLNPGTGAALVLLGWHLLILVLGLTYADGNAVLLMILLLAAYIGILVCLSRIPRTLHLAGFGLHSAPVRISDRTLSCTVIGLTLAGVLCGLLFFRQYPMDWTPVCETPNQQAEQVREELLSAGFPEFVLQDLSDEDVLVMQGASRVVSGTDVHSVSMHREEIREEDGTVYTAPVCDQQELRITGVAVLLPGEQEQWQIIHHFLWEKQPKFFGTESIRLIPADHIEEGWTGNGDLTGRLLCEKEGETLEAPFWFLGRKEAVRHGFQGNSTTAAEFCAGFSLPRRAVRQRGYISYSVSEVQDGCIIYSWFDYTHRDSPLLYPNQSALDHQRSGGWDLKNRFPSVQTAVQFYPFLEGNVLSGYEDSPS